MKNTLLIFLFLLSAIFCRASDAVDAFVHCSAVDSNSVAVVVIDLKSGETIESYNSEKPLLPASVMKTVTIAALIEKSGIDYKYNTSVYLEGKVEDNTLKGNIVVVGSGDPSLNSMYEPGSTDFVAECVSALQKRGIQTVAGGIIIEENIFEGSATPESWDSADMKYGYGTGLHAFNFESNCYMKGSQSYAVKSPANVFIERLKSALTTARITVNGEKIKQKQRQLLFEHQSATIDEIMRSCMMRSDNLFAEALLRTYSLVTDDSPVSATTAAKNAYKFWKNKKLPLDGCELFDGSGLSRKNRLTADFLADVLRKMSDNIDYVSFFPLAGQDGTLKKFLKDTSLDSYIALKTGSMRGVQCYAGYKLDDDYAPTHVVVVMINNFTNRNSVKAKCEEMLLEIFKNS